MARFRFELEPLLAVRRRKERAAQRTVAELERMRRELEDALRRQQELIMSGKTAVRERLVGRLEIDDLRDHAGVAIDHMRRASRTLLDLAGVHKKLESARKELVEASRQRRVVELLRDRRYETWRRAIDRAEDAAIDELAVQAAARPARPARPEPEP